MTAVTLALSTGVVPAENEPWVKPEQLSYTRANDSVDLMSVCKVASHILYLLSGRRYGVRTETVRPGYERHCLDISEYIRLSERAGFPVYAGGRPETVLRLKGPVQAVTSVEVDGVTLDSSEYVLFDRRYLLRTKDQFGGVQRWPFNQLLEAPLTEAGTCAVTYQWGQPVPEGGLLAAQVFAVELAKYVNKDGSALPDRTMSVTRQGVSQTVLDPSQFIKEQRTGLYLPDMWLGAVNPNGMRKRPRVVNPDDVLLARPT